MKTYYHFTSDKLRDGRDIPAIGEWLEHNGDVIPCESGLHASPTAFDALQYAPGAMLHKVYLDGVIVEHGSPVDKYAASRRVIVASIDATDVCRRFARRVALDVAHLWDMPDVVRRYLETGDESLRDAAWVGAWDATGDAAWGARAAAYAARDAAWAAWVAARDAARDAAWAAAWDAAWDAARAAAQAAAYEKYRGWFDEMVEEAFGE